MGGLGFRFLVCENKIFAGREQRAEGEALGRPLAVAWFEKHSSCAQGDILRPVAGHEQQTLALQSTSVAELLRAAGHFVEVAVGTNERDHEVLLESCFLNYSLNKYTVERCPDDSAWSFIAYDPRDVEEVQCSERCMVSFFSHMM